MSRLRAGNLDRRWKIQERQTTTNSFGEEIVEWVAVDTVWGSWEPMKGSEKWTAQQFASREVARVRMRYNDTVTATHRIESDEHGQFEIIGEPEQRRREGETVLHVSRLVGE